MGQFGTRGKGAMLSKRTRDSRSSNVANKTHGRERWFRRSGQKLSLGFDFKLSQQTEGEYDRI